MAQILKIEYVHPETLVDTLWEEEHLQDNNVRIVVKSDAISKNYYNKNAIKFVLCESCYWIASILKEVFKIGQCPRCGKKKLFIERISIQ